MFDLAVIGAGPGGYVSAQRAAAAGLRTVIFEQSELGGVCLNEGCIPTKTILHSTKLFDGILAAGRFGVHADAASINAEEVFSRKDKVVRKLTGAIRVSMKNLGVEVINAEAQIAGGNAEEGFRIKAGEAIYEAKNVLIATGSRSIIPPIPGIGRAITSREALSLREVPASVAIIGGGVIGMEFASIFRSLGAEVVVLEMLPQILGRMDPECSAMLQKACEARGIRFHLSCKVTAIDSDGVHFRSESGEDLYVEAETVLASVGRRANTETFANVPGLRIERGIVVDGRSRTSVPGIFAAGDVTAGPMLAHYASRQGEVAVNTILGMEDSMNVAAIPSVVYTHPEVASVGSAEGCCVKLPLGYSGRFVAETERENGFCKIVYEPETRKVTGVHMIGGPCSEIIAAACIAIEKGATMEDLRRTIFPHPSVSEIIKETAFASVE